jgi:hypothetical protein
VEGNETSDPFGEDQQSIAHGDDRLGRGAIDQTIRDMDESDLAPHQQTTEDRKVPDIGPMRGIVHHDVVAKAPDPQKSPQDRRMVPPAKAYDSGPALARGEALSVNVMNQQIYLKPGPVQGPDLMRYGHLVGIR